MSDRRDPGELPVWDGVPRDEIPLRPVFGLNLFVKLKDRPGFPAGELLADTLNHAALRYIRGASIEVDDKGGTSVALWVPAFEDQQSENRERDEPTEHIPIRESERWEIAELAFAAIGATIPDRAVYFGFFTADSSFVLPWHEYCRHYPFPPEYVFGYWEYVEE